MITYEPLPGVICPHCRMTPVNKDRQMYRWSQDARAWLCPTCQTPYQDACTMHNQTPLLRSEKNQTSIGKEPTNMKKRQAKPQAVDVLRLSHSQLETWTQCQLRWRFNKIDQLPAAPSEALIFGTALHAALEADGRQAIQHREMQDYELLAAFDDTLVSELAKCDPTGLIPRARHAAMRARAQDIIQKYIAIVQPNYRPLEVEQEFSLQLAPDVAFTGRIDAITASSILDWKTASKPWEPDSQHHKDQATAYLLARPDASRVSFAVFSGEGESLRFQSLATERTEAQKEDYARKVLGIASDIREAKATDTFMANPGPLCGWCSYLGACTAGQAWLKVKGKVPQVPVLKYQRSESEGANDAE